MPTPSEVLAEAKRLSDAKRPLAAISKLEPLLPKISDAATRAMICFNLGVQHWSQVGDGVRAKFHFLASYEESTKTDPNSQVAQVLQPNACENLMVLSTSYEEYDRWAEILRKLRPNAPILSGQRPRIIESRDKGIPWSKAMSGIAHGYYNRADPQHDAGQYGQAASIYHLLLMHRRELRVTREEWARAAYEYGVLRFRLGPDTLKAAKQSNPTVDPREFSPIVKDALPLVQECFSANPNDPNIKSLIGHMEDWVLKLEHAEPPPEFELKGAQASSGGDSRVMRCPGCHKQVTMSAFECPSCGLRLKQLPLAFLKTLAFSAVAFFGIRYAFADVPVWVAPLVALVAFFGFTGRAISRLQTAPSPPPSRSAAVHRQEKIDELLGTQRRAEVFCRRGHKMRSLEDEGVLLATCPDCGIVKPYPGCPALLEDIMRVAVKYDNFEF